MEALIPLLLVSVGLYALHRRVAVFPVFLQGAQKGLRTAVSILPTMIGVLSAVAMLRASGAVELLADLLQPVLSAVGIPAECAPLVLLKPISGGGGLALGIDIMQHCGVDSVAGLTAAVMLGASETSLYTISVYSGHIGLPRLRYAVAAALLADAAAFWISSMAVKLFLDGVIIR